MMATFIEKNVEGVGVVLFVRSLRAKRINLSIKPFEGVRVSVPKGVSFQQAEQFVLKKTAWIQKNSSKVKKIESQKRVIVKQLGQMDIESAKAKLIQRLSEMAKEHGFNFRKVTIRHQKTKWGSCSYQNNISLNIQLTLLPQELIDYVLLHELVHTKIKNHSPHFWMELDKYVGDAKTLRSKLNQFLIDGDTN